MEATRKAAAGRRRGRFGSHGKGDIPLLQESKNAPLLDHVAYDPLESLESDAAALSSCTSTTPPTPDAFAKDWLLFGGGSSSETPLLQQSSPSSSCSTSSPIDDSTFASTPNQKPLSTAKTAATTTSSSTSTSSSSIDLIAREKRRGRSRRGTSRAGAQPLLSPRIWESPERQERRRARSLETNRPQYRSSSRPSRSKRSSVATAYSPLVADSAAGLLDTDDSYAQTSPTVAASVPIETTARTNTKRETLADNATVPANERQSREMESTWQDVEQSATVDESRQCTDSYSPYSASLLLDDKELLGSLIPDDVVDPIVAAFGPSVNLYRDVLDIADYENASSITPAKLRVAYFRQGRHVMQQRQPKLSSSLSTREATLGFCSNNVTPKQRFQAVTKAYAILTHPDWKAYYETYGLRPQNMQGGPPVRASHPVSSPTSTATFHVMVEDGIQPHCQPAERQPVDNTRNLQSTEGQGQERQQPPPPLHDEIDDDDDDDASSAYSTYSGSGISILRRSNSWGPTRSRSTSRSRVNWKEEVEELLYEPDPVSLNSSGETARGDSAFFPPFDDGLDAASAARRGRRGAANRAARANKSRFVIDSPGLTEDLEKLDSNFKRDFLDDLEASLDGLEAKIGGFVKYALSKKGNPKPDAGSNASQSLDEEKKCDDDAEHDTDGQNAGSSIARQLFSDLTAPPSTTSNSTAVPGPAYPMVQTTSAPLKEGHTGQPRVVPKKKRHKRRVDRVPTDQEIFESRGAEVIIEAYEEDDTPATTTGQAPAGGGWNVQDALASMANLLGAGPATASTSLSDNASEIARKRGSAVATQSHRRDRLLDYYDLQSNSSILASLGDTVSANDETTTVVSSVQPPPQPQAQQVADTGLDFGAINTLTFSEALNITSDATTKGFVRLDRYPDGEASLSQSPMDTSDVTFMSKTTAELMAHNMPDCFGAFAKHAQETLREVASVDEGDPIRRKKSGMISDASPTANSGSNSNNLSSPSIFSSIGTYFQSLIEDAHVFGQSIGANLGDVNQTVVETMSFTEEYKVSEDEVDGMLKVLESELNATDIQVEQSTTHQS